MYEHVRNVCKYVKYVREISLVYSRGSDTGSLFDPRWTYELDDTLACPFSQIIPRRAIDQNLFNSIGESSSFELVQEAIRKF